MDYFTLIKPMKMYELFSKPGTWTCKTFARNISNNSCTYDDINANCWCILGAVYHCYDKNEWDEIRSKIYEKLNPNKYVISTSEWNDDSQRTQGDVYNLCKELDI